MEEFLKPMNITRNKLAMDLHVPTPPVTDIVKGVRGIPADTALRLEKYFSTGPEFRCSLQMNYGLGVSAKAITQEMDRIPQMTTA